MASSIATNSFGSVLFMVSAFNCKLSVSLQSTDRLLLCFISPLFSLFDNCSNKAYEVEEHKMVNQKVIIRIFWIKL
ncbi:unnamed protein product [Trichobilharzia szidati]|nr:unnamed protein product [Trichobilharzia szidati]